MLYNYYYIQELNYFSALMLNIIIYLINTYLIFLIFFLFDLKKFINLNQIKVFRINNFTTMSIIFTLLSYSGMPLMIGFSGKFLLNVLILLKSNFFFFLFFFFWIYLWFIFICKISNI